MLFSQYVAIRTLVHLLCSDGKIILTATVSSARRWYIRLGLPKSNIYLVIVIKCHKLADTGRSCLAVYHASYNALVTALNHNMKNIWVYLRLCPCYKCITRNGFDPWLKTKHIVLANQVYKHIHLASSRHSISTRKNIQTISLSRRILNFSYRESCICRNVEKQSLYESLVEFHRYVSEHHRHMAYNRMIWDAIHPSWCCGLQWLCVEYLRIVFTKTALCRVNLKNPFELL